VTERPALRLSSRDIAQEITRTRARMGKTLGALDREYALRHLFVRAVRLARHPEGSARAVRQVLHQEALPIAVVGLGLGWLSLSRRWDGTDLLHRLTTALATLQRIAGDLGLLPPPAPPPGAAAAPVAESPATDEGSVARPS
jgi:hypothetical protein